MKKLLCLCLGLYLNHAAAAPHLELVKKHISDFINMALITQLFPLNDGGYIVQRYGHLVARYDSNSELIKEIDLGTDNYIYQKGMQLKDGRIVFIDDSSMISFYDMDLNKISQVYVPREYLWAPCEINNGKLVFGTYNEELMVVMNNEGKLTEIGNLGNHLRKTFCVDNQAMVMSENGTLSIVDLEQDEPKLIYQKDFNYINKSISLKNQKLNFLTYEGLNIVDPKTFIEGFWPNDQIRQYDGVEYFSDGRYVLINTVRNDQGNYDSKLQVYSKEGMVLYADHCVRPHAQIFIGVHTETLGV